MSLSYYDAWAEAERQQEMSSTDDAMWLEQLEWTPGDEDKLTVEVKREMLPVKQEVDNDEVPVEDVKDLEKTALDDIKDALVNKLLNDAIAERNVAETPPWKKRKKTLPLAPTSKARSMPVGVPVPPPIEAPVPPPPKAMPVPSASSSSALGVPSASSSSALGSTAKASARPPPTPISPPATLPCSSAQRVTGKASKQDDAVYYAPCWQIQFCLLNSLMLSTPYVVMLTHQIHQILFQEMLGSRRAYERLVRNQFRRRGGKQGHQYGWGWSWWS